MTATLTYSSPATACGGTFCDAGPNAMPVDQTGENILFVMGKDFTEAHIQIQYDPSTEADKFAWVVPLLALPEFSIGSDPLFDNLLNSTVPSYGFTTQSSCEARGTFGPSDGAGGDGGSASGGDDGEGGGPDVVFQETVGAFDITVLQGGTSEELMTWLGDNGYQQDPAAEPILQEYLTEGYLFAAFKLNHDAGVSEIHPIALRFPIAEACVPLRLTRIAAQDDMDVRTFFLADHRVVPQTYKHVLVNPLKLDWPNFASNYKEVITLAVDADQANGKAFVTEYAATSDVVFRAGIWAESWNSEPFATMDASLVVDELKNQQLLWCEPGHPETHNDGWCEFYHPLIQGLLQRHLPVPEGVDEGDFYGCTSCYADLLPEAWDPAAFASDLEARIFAPGRHAAQLLDMWPTLTRMYTTISPNEMTADPFFHQNADLPEVDLRSQVATQTLDCDGNALWTLPDGREVYVPAGQSWPAFDDEMPWEAAVQETPAFGAPMMLVNNEDKIDLALATYNCEHKYPTWQMCAGLAQDDDATASGCGCTTEPSGRGAAWSLFVLALGTLARRSTAARRKV